VAIKVGLLGRKVFYCVAKMSLKKIIVVLLLSICHYQLVPSEILTFEYGLHCAGCNSAVMGFYAIIFSFFISAVVLRF
jgi:hypothetical protein